MSDVAPIDGMLKRVEQMLDALYVSDQSSKDFRDGCHQLERYLTDQKAPLLAGGALSEPHKARVAVIIKRLAGLQKTLKQGPIFQLGCKIYCRTVG